MRDTVIQATIITIFGIAIGVAGAIIADWPMIVLGCIFALGGILDFVVNRKSNK